MGLVDCTGKIMSDGRLPDVESFPTNTSTYNFGDCGVNHVDYDYFLAFPTIAVIRGDNNHIREPFLVPPTTSLLYLSNNSLTTTSDFFNTSFSYNNLQEVDLSYNSISVLHSGAFKGLNHLKSLNLFNMRNGIQKLETNCIADLPSLSLLNLNGNNIQYVSSDALRNLASSWNPLKLSLSRNNLTVLPAKFVDMPYLERLSVKQSKIKRIHPLAFSMTPRLLSIDLSYNSLTEFHNGTFNLSRDLPIELFLDANMLETISGGSFQKGMTIRHLYILLFV
jgi:Leucine-rich repeat (LRR) protein